MIDKKKQGKRNLEKGRRFENKVRKDLESKGWVVSRWQNNVKTKSKQGLFLKTSVFLSRGKTI